MDRQWNRNGYPQCAASFLAAKMNNGHRNRGPFYLS
jgi:hypothetical protein